MRVALAIVLLAAGCVPFGDARAITGPDGTQDWAVVRCSSDKLLCYEHAAISCHGHYEIVNEDRLYAAHSFGSAYSSSTYTTRSDEMLIHCLSRITPEPPRAPAEVPAICAMASEHLRALANLWVEEHPGREPLAELPARAAFLGACASVDDSTRLCLDAPYHLAHIHGCTATLAEVTARDKFILDRLFLAR